MAGSADIGTAWINVVPSFRGFSKNVARELGGLSTSMSKQSATSISSHIGGAFRGIQKVGKLAFAAVGAAATVGLKDAVKRVDTMRSFPKVMQNLGYSADEAQASIKKMSDKLTGLPTTLDSVAMMTKQLAPLTGSLSKATDLSLALNNAFLASGASAEDVSRGMQQYAQMLAKGSVDLQSWRTLQETIPGQLDQIAKAMLGPTANSNQLYEALKNGKVSFDQFNDTILKLNEEGVNGLASFSQQARDQTKGIGTAFTNLRTAMVRAKSGIIEALGAEDIASTVNNAGGAVTRFGKKLEQYIKDTNGASSATKDFASRLGTLAAGIGIAYAAVSAGANFETISSGFDKAGKKFDEFKKHVKANSDTISTRLYSLFNREIREAATMDGDVFANVITQMGQGKDRIKAGLDQMVTPFKGVAAKVAAPFKRVAETVSGVTGKINEKFKALASGLGEHAKGLGSKLDGLKNLIVDKTSGILTPLNNVFGGFKDMITAPLEAALGGLGSKISEFFSPTRFMKFFALGAIAAALIGGLGAIASQGGSQMIADMQAAAQQLPSKIQEAVSGFAANASQFMALGVDLVMTVVEGLTGAAPQIITGAISVLDSFIIGLGQALPRLVPAAIGLVSTIVTSLLGQLPMIVQAGLDLLVGLIQGISNALPQIVALMPTIITTIVSTLIGALPQIITAGVGILTALIDGIINTLPELVNMIPQIVTGIVDALVNNLPLIISAGIQLIVALISGIVKAIPQLVTMLPGLVVRIVETLLVNFPKIVVAGAKAIGSLITGLVGALPGLWSTIRQIPSKIVQALGNLGQLLYGAGRAIINGLWEGMKSLIGMIKDGLHKLTSWLPDWKGPASVDKKILYNSGRLVIQGFKEGLESQYAGVKASLGGFTQGLNGPHITPTLTAQPLAAATSQTPQTTVRQYFPNVHDPQAAALAAAQGILGMPFTTSRGVFNGAVG